MTIMTNIALGLACEISCLSFLLQWRTKILGTVIKILPSTSLTYQMFRCSIVCTSLTTWIPRLALPSPPPSKQCWDEETLSGQGKVYRGAQTTTLIGGKAEKLRQIVLIVLRILSSIVAARKVFAGDTSWVQPQKFHNDEMIQVLHN